MNFLNLCGITWKEEKGKEISRQKTVDLFCSLCLGKYYTLFREGYSLTNLSKNGDLSEGFHVREAPS